MLLSGASVLFNFSDSVYPNFRVSTIILFKSKWSVCCAVGEIPSEIVNIAFSDW